MSIKFPCLNSNFQYSMLMFGNPKYATEFSNNIYRFNCYGQATVTTKLTLRRIHSATMFRREQNRKPIATENVPARLLNPKNFNVICLFIRGENDNSF